MSFMFKPYPYDDLEAVNTINDLPDLSEEVVSGNGLVVNHILAQAEKVYKEKGYCRVGIDGYPTADFTLLRTVLEQTATYDFPFSIFTIDSLYKEEEEVSDMLLNGYLPEDREKDPVLLYGKIYDKPYESLMKTDKLEGLKELLNNIKAEKKGIIIVLGLGTFCDTLIEEYDYRLFADVIPMRCMLAINSGRYHNIATKKALPVKKMARRSYYVDFELAVHTRLRLLKEHLLDEYILASNSNQLQLIPIAVMNRIFTSAMSYPLRCKPVYIEGIWGGYYVQRLRHLPKEMKNCAWVFDMIPMEVSIVFKIKDICLEFPFQTFAQAKGDELMGKRSVERFGYYFPVRFNYDDTFHSSGNMSIQCHPNEKFVKEQNGELGRQDESYYVVATGQEAKTFLGFNEGVDVEQFIEDAKKSETLGTPVDYEYYVNAVNSKPGIQFMIPAGMIHCSGRNQLILEIGSLTIGSYTYKMYDYLRKDFDGKPRPIHTYYGERVLEREKRKNWVENNLVNGNERIVRSGEDWLEKVVGEHELLYFSLRNLIFKERIEDDTNGTFHVLSLVDGEKVKIVSKLNPNHFYYQNYLDIILIPADFGPYEIINLLPGTKVVEHKTMLNPDHD